MQSSANRTFRDALPPFPRSVWIHPCVPRDGYDLVCQTIWSRASEIKREEELYGARSSPQRRRNETCTPSDCKPKEKSEMQRGDLDESGSSKQREKKLYPHDLLPIVHSAIKSKCSDDIVSALVQSSEREVKEKENDGEVEEKIKLGKQTDDKQRRTEKPNEVRASRSTNGGKQSFAPEIEDSSSLSSKDCPPDFNVVRSPTSCEDEEEEGSSSGGSSSDENVLPGLRSCATDSSDDDSSENSLPSDKSSAEDSSSGRGEDFTPRPDIKAGSLLYPTERSALGKVHRLWEIPHSVHPHDNPAASLACEAVPVHTPVQSKARRPQATAKTTNAPPVVPKQQGPYDLLEDFPPLNCPEKPSAPERNRPGKRPTQDTKWKRGATPSPSLCQASGVSRERGPQKMLGRLLSSTSDKPKPPVLIFEEAKGHNQPSQQVAGADGMGANAKTWLHTAKAGTKRAAAPQEKVRPWNSPQIGSINTAKGGYPLPSEVTNKVTPSYPPNWPPPCPFVSPSYSRTHPTEPAPYKSKLL